MCKKGEEEHRIDQTGLTCLIVQDGRKRGRLEREGRGEEGGDPMLERG